MNYDTITFTEEGEIATIELNRPKVFNALNQSMRKELLTAVNYVEESSTLKVCIIRGAGPGFSAGADLTEPAPTPISDQIDYEYKPVLERIHHGDKLYIAQVHKNASGAGAGLALACDFLIMDEGASIYMAFSTIGLVPDCGASWQLLHAMGRRHALEAIIEGKHISAQQCHHYGLANHVVALDALTETTETLAKSLTKKSLPALSATKRLLHSKPFASLGDTISAEAQEQNPLILDDYFKAAVAKFFKKPTSA